MHPSPLKQDRLLQSRVCSNVCLAEPLGIQVQLMLEATNALNDVLCSSVIQNLPAISDSLVSPVASSLPSPCEVKSGSLRSGLQCGCHRSTVTSWPFMPDEHMCTREYLVGEIVRCCSLERATSAVDAALLSIIQMAASAQLQVGLTLMQTDRYCLRLKADVSAA